MESRQEFNREIINRISEYNEKYPDMRFHQILHNLNILSTTPEIDGDGLHTGKMLIDDQYHEESKKTLQSINESAH